MSNIQKIPLVTLTVEIATNEPLTDAWGYVDGSGNPISGAGIALSFMVRAVAGSEQVLIAATNTGAASLNGVVVNGTIAWGGVGGNLVVPNIPVATIAAMPPGTYAGEVLAAADGIQKRIALVTLIIDQGIVQ